VVLCVQVCLKVMEEECCEHLLVLSSKKKVHSQHSRGRKGKGKVTKTNIYRSLSRSQFWYCVMSGKPAAIHFENPWGIRGFGRTVIIASALGAALGLGYALATFSNLFVDFGLYLIGVSLFHLWEYIFVCIYHPVEVTTNCMYLV
jgi:hypothetical protein